NWTALLVPRRLPRITKALHLEPTRRRQSRSVETTCPSVLEPLHDGVGIRLSDPTLLIKIEILKDRFLRLQHESHATCSLRERDQTISKGVGFVIELGHLVPPMMNLCKTIMRGWDWTRAPLRS